MDAATIMSILNKKKAEAGSSNFTDDWATQFQNDPQFAKFWAAMKEHGQTESTSQSTPAPPPTDVAVESGTVGKQKAKKRKRRAPTPPLPRSDSSDDEDGSTNTNNEPQPTPRSARRATDIAIQILRKYMFPLIVLTALLALCVVAAVLGSAKVSIWCGFLFIEIGVSYAIDRIRISERLKAKLMHISKITVYLTGPVAFFVFNFLAIYLQPLSAIRAILIIIGYLLLGFLGSRLSPSEFCISAFIYRANLMQLLFLLVAICSGPFEVFIQFLGTTLISITDVADYPISFILPNANDNFFAMVVGGKIMWTVFLVSFLTSLPQWTRAFSPLTFILSCIFHVDGNELLETLLAALLSPSEVLTIMLDNGRLPDSIFVMFMAGGSASLVGIYAGMGLSVRGLVVATIFNFVGCLMFLRSATLFSCTTKRVPSRPKRFMASLAAGKGAWVGIVTGVFIAMCIYSAINQALTSFGDTDALYGYIGHGLTFPLLIGSNISTNASEVIYRAHVNKFFQNEFVALSQIAPLKGEIPSDYMSYLTTALYGFTNLSLIPIVSYMFIISGRPGSLVPSMGTLLLALAMACTLNYLVAISDCHYTILFASLSSGKY